MQVPNGTGPGVRRSKRPLLASRTRCNDSHKSTPESVAVVEWPLVVSALGLQNAPGLVTDWVCPASKSRYDWIFWSGDVKSSKQPNTTTHNKSTWVQDQPQPHVPELCTNASPWEPSLIFQMHFSLRALTLGDLVSAYGIANINLSLIELNLLCDQRVFSLFTLLMREWGGNDLSINVKDNLGSLYSQDHEGLQSADRFAKTGVVEWVSGWTTDRVMSHTCTLAGYKVYVKDPKLPM